MEINIYDHSSNDRRFYVYSHIDINGNTAYIGSGTLKRVFSKSDRSAEHLSIWDTLTKIILHDGLNSKEARDIEQFYIINLAPSLNKTNTVSKVPTYEYNFFKEYFEYDPMSPSCLSWIESKRPKHIKSKFAGTLHSKGYWKVGVQRKCYSCSRIVICLLTKSDIPDNLVVDHIDRNRSNNNENNLRLVTHHVNSLNKGRRKDNKTGVVGVRWCVTLNVWYCTWTENLKRFSKSFNPVKLYPHLDFNKAKELTFNDAVKFRNNIVNSVYKNLVKITTECYNDRTTVD